MCGSVADWLDGVDRQIDGSGRMVLVRQGEIWTVRKSCVWGKVADWLDNVDRQMDGSGMARFSERRDFWDRWK